MSIHPLHPARYPVAFVGIGNMGFGMAARLLDQGWPVHVCDLDARRCADAAALGATVHPTPAQAAAALGDGGLLVVAVVDAAQCETVMWGAGGATHALRPGQTVMWCPTIAPDTVESLAQRLAEAGVHSIDSPMSGGPMRARDGSMSLPGRPKGEYRSAQHQGTLMSLMVACPNTVFDAHASVLAALSNQVFRLGDRVGDGARTKLVNNLLAGINLVAAAEVLALAQAMGLDQAQTLDVIERSSGQSWIGSDRMRRAMGGDLAPRAHMTLLAKDTRVANEAAATAGFAGPLGERAATVFRMACEHGLADLDDGALLAFLQQQGSAR